MSARPLRIVESEERTYIVARTQLASPGRPYVVSECTPGALVAPPPGLETLSRSEMREDPLLREALRAWDEQDDRLAQRERESRANLGKSGARAMARALHPSARPNAMRLSGPLRPGA